MDSNLRELSGLMRGMSCDDSYSHHYTPSQYGLHEFQPLLDSTETSFVQKIGDNNPKAILASNFYSKSVVDSHEYCEITSDAALNYISQMLMEEGIDEKVSLYQEEAALRAMEKPFYDIVGQKYPPTLDSLLLYSQRSSTCTDECSSSSHGQSNSGGSGSELVDNNIWSHQSAAYSNGMDFSSQPLLGTSSGAGNILEFAYLLPDSQVESLSTLQFTKGIEEAKKFLPSIDTLVIDMEANTVSFPQRPKKDSPLVEVKVEEEEHEKEHMIYGSRGKKKPHDGDLDLLEGRSNKQSAVYFDDPLQNEMSDKLLLLCQRDENYIEDVIQLRGLTDNEASKNPQNGLTKGPKGGNKRGKKQTKEETVDLSTLLMHCAQAVAIDDRPTAAGLLKQIREHSSPNGDGSQRVAHWFANGPEARLAGTGSLIYQKLIEKPIIPSDMLEAFHLYIEATPFYRAIHYFCNHTILNVAEKASKVHVVDFGIEFGFNWPAFIQRLSRREGGPPKLRITGIEVPQPGFRPTKQVEEAGRWLADCARKFQVPFEYQAIATKYETVRVEDINIDEDEVLVVTSFFRLKNVIDETVVMDSPRDRVLKIMKRMNPSVFILGTVNASYNGPFFVTRFREALFHYIGLFDMRDKNFPRDNKQRLLIEKQIFGRDAVNVIACEGLDRIERPETYKQWQVRILRAGFTELPLNPTMMKTIKNKVSGIYHKDFVVDNDSPWLLLGWKGRISSALSAWKPSQT